MKQSFNENWICYKTGDKENAFAVTLPMMPCSCMREARQVPAV